MASEKRRYVIALPDISRYINVSKDDATIHSILGRPARQRRFKTPHQLRVGTTDRTFDISLSGD